MIPGIPIIRSWPSHNLEMRCISLDFLYGSRALGGPISSGLFSLRRPSSVSKLWYGLIQADLRRVLGLLSRTAFSEEGWAKVRPSNTAMKVQM